MYGPIFKGGRAMLRHEWAGSTGVILRPQRKPIPKILINLHQKKKTHNTTLSNTEPASIKQRPKFCRVYKSELFLKHCHIFSESFRETSTKAFDEQSRLKKGSTRILFAFQALVSATVAGGCLGSERELVDFRFRFLYDYGGLIGNLEMGHRGNQNENYASSREFLNKRCTRGAEHAPRRATGACAAVPRPAPRARLARRGWRRARPPR
uniref:SFRICE_008336 n=1 Tax=Spodoptera frugiperda TaxID=7108 RepID=A0A2H1VJK5_SPOFR